MEYVNSVDLIPFTLEFLKERVLLARVSLHPSVTACVRPLLNSAAWEFGTQTAHTRVSVGCRALFLLWSKQRCCICLVLQAVVTSLPYIWNLSFLQ